jgi:hypothetical protein
MLCMEVSMVYIVVVDGKGYGLFGSNEVASMWAADQFPVAFGQSRVVIVPFEYISVNELLPAPDDSELPDAARKMRS